MAGNVMSHRGRQNGLSPSAPGVPGKDSMAVSHSLPTGRIDVVGKTGAGVVAIRP